MIGPAPLLFLLYRITAHCQAFCPQKTPADRGKAEQGIMEAKSADTFKPEGWTPKFNVIETWNKAFPKH